MINKEGLDKITSSKIRAHLTSTFNQSFDDYRKEVDLLTKQVIERREKRVAQAPSEPGDTEENQSPEKSAAADAASDKRRSVTLHATAVVLTKQSIAGQRRNDVLKKKSV
ncbi:hypothetical protein COOONC_17981 [Cooperia oncophora]